MPPKSKKPVRQRFVPKRRTKYFLNLKSNSGSNSSNEVITTQSSSSDVNTLQSSSNDEPSSSSCSSPEQSVWVSDHDYCKSPTSSEADVSLDDASAADFSPNPVLSPVSMNVMVEVKAKLDWFLYQNWMSIFQQDSISVFCVSPGKNIAIQRSVLFETNGNVEVFVHGEKLDVGQFMTGLDAFQPLDENNVNQFVDRMVVIISNLRAMQICSGYDEEKFKSVWSICPYGVVDKNLFREHRYEETFRSHSCLRLVHHRKWRCTECAKLYKPLKRKSLFAAVDKPKLNTANKYLTEEQMLTKLSDQAKTIEAAKRKISHMTGRMQLMLTKSGVNLDNDLSDNLTELLESGQMTEAQSVFLQQQVKASQKKNMVGMRWHPTMIRLALAIHLTSPAAYELMRDTGMIKLPSSRTLFDYSHVKPVQEGIDQYVLDSVGERVAKFKKKHQRYHVLMADEMHISQNLIFQKHTGKMIGYTSLDTLDSEVKVFEEYLENPDKEVEPRIASKVLVYMIKGVSNGIKEVVATFAVASPSVCQMYDWTWKIIRSLESSGVWVIAMVCDGFSTNRAFIRMHKPATPHDNNIIFDTVNRAARHRNLYFIADVPHLLKTIRNCMLNSRWDKVKSRRRMMKNGKKISWDYIIKLYNSKKHKSFHHLKTNPFCNIVPDKINTGHNSQSQGYYFGFIPTQKENLLTF
ncbi:S-methyl-5'-thioadenosine phosphorylase [Frankliniella fusca]|uniref:S-methyl-5'-thioadenosine phosphorylase n=1 Tax=Frankliniella fusca TaxID=407009 RepID=A0AAE1LUC8_9NEOP|nr:S-methyl-5'-thioadenosine phosphorylase [Frankliniella fusca]